MRFWVMRLMLHLIMVAVTPICILFLDKGKLEDQIQDWIESL